jgi:hypothetical protein
MSQINATHKEIGDAEEEEIVIVHDLPGVPGNHENTAGDGDGKYLGYAVEKQVTIEACQVEPEEDRYCPENIYGEDHKFDTNPLSCSRSVRKRTLCVKKK